MPLKLEGISPENELQQNLEQLNITDNKCDVDQNLRENELEGESTSYDKGQDSKPTSDNNNNTVNEINELTCHSEDGGHEIGSNVTNDNDKDNDATSSADETDFSLPKHRKDYPSDDDRTDSEPLSNEEDEVGSEDSNYRAIPPRKFPSPSEIYTPYEQVTPVKPSNTHLQINGANVPFEISPMSLGESSLQDDDIDVARIVNPIVSCIADLKSEFHTELAKLHYYPEPSLDGVEVDENWQHNEFEKSQDQYCYDAIATAGKLLDVIMPMQLPEEAKEHLAQARHILLNKALHYRTTLSTENATALVATPDDAAKSSAEFVSSNTNENNKSSEGLSAQAESSVNKAENKTSTVVKGTNNESDYNYNVTIPYKYRRGSTQGRKLRRHPVRGTSTYSPKSGRRGQNYSPRAANVRSPRVGSTVTSSIAGSATQANNRRFVGFLPSRCFTCGGIGHFANSCPNKGSYISTSTSDNQQPSRSRRRTSVNRFRKPTEPTVKNSASNE